MQRVKPTPFPAIKHDEPKRLPQKQGLCQVVKRPDNRNIIRLLTGISLAVRPLSKNSRAREIGKSIN
jgi:hypothetical protein